MTKFNLEQKINQINTFDDEDTGSEEYREWDNFMYRVHSVARKERDKKIMIIVGDSQRDREIDSLDSHRVAIFANKNSVKYN